MKSLWHVCDRQRAHPQSIFSFLLSYSEYPGSRKQSISLEYRIAWLSSRRSNTISISSHWQSGQGLISNPKLLLSLLSFQRSLRPHRWEPLTDTCDMSVQKKIRRMEWERRQECERDRGKWGNEALLSNIRAIATLSYLSLHLCLSWSRRGNLLPVSWGTNSLPGRRLRRSSRLLSRLNLAAWLRANSARSSL